MTPEEKAAKKEANRRRLNIERDVSAVLESQSPDKSQRALGKFASRCLMDFFKTMGWVDSVGRPVNQPKPDTDAG